MRPSSTSTSVAIASVEDREATECTTDGVFLPEDGDEAVYEQKVQPLVHSVLLGLIATIFAYGASSSGKTHTMLGLAKRVIDELFARYDPRTWTVTVTIEELYNEKSRNLLAALPGHMSVQLSRAKQEHSSKPSSKGSSNSSSSTGPLGLLEGREVRSSDELKELVGRALAERATSATFVNKTSSRSHAIITLTVQQRMRIGSNGASAADDDDSDSSPASSPGASRAASRRCSSSGSLNAEGSSAALDSPRSESDAAGGKAGDDLDGGVFTYLTGKLYLVDLAGSENIKLSGAKGQQQKEASSINKSLSYLKTVITWLLRGKRSPQTGTACSPGGLSTRWEATASCWSLRASAPRRRTWR